MIANCDAFIPAVKAVFEEDRSKTRREIADEVPVSSSSVHKILTDKLDKTKALAKWVPHLWNQDGNFAVCTANIVIELLRLYNWETLNQPPIFSRFGTLSLLPFD